MTDVNFEYALCAIYPLIGTCILTLLRMDEIQNKIYYSMYFVIDKIYNFNSITILIIVNIIGIYLILLKINIEINIKFSLK